MSDKKDFSKQRLSDFLAARLRARGLMKVRLKRAGVIRSRRRRLPPKAHLAVLRILNDLSQDAVVRTRPDRGASAMSRNSDCCTCNFS